MYKIISCSQINDKKNIWEVVIRVDKALHAFKLQFPRYTPKHKIKLKFDELIQDFLGYRMF